MQISFNFLIMIRQMRSRYTELGKFFFLFFFNSVKQGFNNKCNLRTRSARIRQGLLITSFSNGQILYFAHNKERLSSADRHLVCVLKQMYLPFTILWFHSEGFCLSDVRRENTVSKRKHYVWFYFHQITPLTPTQSMGHHWGVNWSILFVTKRDELPLGLKIITIHKNYWPPKFMIIFVPKKDFLSGLYIRSSPL